MANLQLSNNIETGTLVSAAEHEQNYTEIENFVNSEVLHADGSIEMDPGSQLLLGGDATSSNAAVTKSQLDAAVGSSSNGIEYFSEENAVGWNREQTTGTNKFAGLEVTHTAPSNGLYIVKLQFDISPLTSPPLANSFLGHLHINGAETVQEVIYTAYGRATVHGEWFVPATAAATTTFTMSGRQLSGSGTWQLNGSQTRMDVLYIPS